MSEEEIVIRKVKEKVDQMLIAKRKAEDDEKADKEATDYAVLLSASDAIITAINENKTNAEDFASVFADAVSKIKIEMPQVNVPEIKLPTINVPEVKVQLPTINIPPIKIPEVKIPKIVVPKPEVTVNIPKQPPPIVNIPPFPNEIEISNKRLDVTLVDIHGKPVVFQNVIPLGGNSGGGSGGGSGNASTTKTNVLSGEGANGSRELTLANTWYSVPSTVPMQPYQLVATIETTVGVIRWGFDNTGTPSTANGNLAPGELKVNLYPGQVIYYTSSSASDDVNWTTKII